MKKRTIEYIVIVISIIISVICIGIIYKNNNKSVKYNTNNFEHRDISRLSFSEREFQYYKNGHYGHTEKTMKGYVYPSIYYDDDDDIVENTKGKYYAAKIPFTSKMTIIEENVISYKHDGGYEGPIIESILYSKQKLKKDYVSSYLHELHNDDSCGTDLKSFKRIENNYYYIKYQIPEEC